MRAALLRLSGVGRWRGGRAAKHAVAGWLAFALLLLTGGRATAQSGRVGAPDALYVEYAVTGGAELRQTRTGVLAEYEGVWTQRRFTLKGLGRIVVGPSLRTTGSIAADIKGIEMPGAQSFVWPGPGESGDIAGGSDGTTVERSFNLEVEIPAGYRGPVSITAYANKVEGTSEVVGVSIWLRPAPGAGAPVSPTQPRPGTGPPAEQPEAPEASSPAPWGIVVGGLALLGIAALALAALAAARALRPKPQSLPYLLQLSSDRLELRPGETRRVEIRAYRVTPAGATLPATDALIALTPPRGLLVAPSHGTGAMVVDIHAPSGSPPSTLAIAVLASGGGGHAAATIQVQTAAPHWDAWVNGKAEAEIFFDRSCASYLVPEVVAFFHHGDERPVEPGIPYRLATPCWQASSPALELVAVYSHAPHQWTLRLRVRPGAELPAKITVCFDVVDWLGRPERAQVVLWVRPPLDLRLLGYRDDPRVAAGHAYQGLSLGELGFVADGVDELRLSAMLVRADSPGQQVAQDAAAALVVELAGADAARFELTEESARPPPGVKTLRLRSREPLLYEGDVSLELVVRCELAAPERYRLRESILRRAARPSYLYLRLWALPGLMPGTTEVAAFVRVPHVADGFIAGVPVELGVEEPADGPRLTLQSDAQQRTYPEGYAGWLLRYAGLTWANVEQAQFRLKAGFPAQNGRPRRAVELTIDVAQNLANVLTLLVQERNTSELNLDNPTLARNRASASAVHAAAADVVDFVVPDCLYGPAWNAAKSALELAALACQALQTAVEHEPQGAAATIAVQMALEGHGVSRERAAELAKTLVDLLRPGQRLAVADLQRKRAHFESVAASMVPFVCGSLSRRIAGWFQRLRLGGSSLSRRALLNGMEHAEYGVSWGLHVFAGVHLSSQGPGEDPRFIDPWWRQGWELESYWRPTGLLTPTQELLNAKQAAESLGTVAVLGAALVAPQSVPLTAALVTLAAGVALVGSFDWFVRTDAHNLDADGRYELPGSPRLADVQPAIVRKGHKYYWEAEARAWLVSTLPLAPAVSPVRSW